MERRPRMITHAPARDVATAAVYIQGEGRAQVNNSKQHKHEKQRGRPTLQCTKHVHKQLEFSHVDYSSRLEPWIDTNPA